MSTYFTIPTGTLAAGLAAALIAALIALAVLAWRQRLMLRLGLRNIPRRRTQMTLIVAGLMLSTMLVTCALATGDTMAATLRVQVLQQMGRTDEIVTIVGTDFFPLSYYDSLRGALRGNPEVAALVPAINRGSTVVADLTVRQISSGVALLGVPPDYSDAFGPLLDARGRPLARGALATLAPDEVYANAALARNLAAAAGHRLYAFFSGKRVPLRLRGVLANGDISGTRPTLLTSLANLQRLTDAPGQINRVMVANAGTLAQNVERSDDVTAAIQSAPVAGQVNVEEVTQEATQATDRAEDIFTRIFTLFTLFAVAVSILLIFLIFNMLAAERRGEMGVTRALGAQRGHLVATFLFEGAAYDLVAALVGLGAGAALGWGIIQSLAGVFDRFQVHIGFALAGQSITLAYCLGALCTLLTVLASAWWVSRLNLVAAIRGLPDVPALSAGAWESLRALRTALARLSHAVRQRQRADILDAVGQSGLGLLACLWALTTRGVLLLPAGLWLAQQGYAAAAVTPFSAGISLVALAGGLLVRWVLHLGGEVWEPLGRWADRCGYTVAGLGLLAYWILPYSTLYQWGLPRFDGGIEVFFVAGLMMVGGAVWVTIYNVELLVRPLSWALYLLGRAAVALRTALAYPLHHRYRTGLTLAMFSMVVFTLTVMSVVSYASQDSYDNPNAMGNGFAIQAHTIYTPVPHIEAAMAASPYVRSTEFAAIGTQTYQPIGVIQLSAPRPSWSLYLASVVNRGFLSGTHIMLGTRARGYHTDQQVWQAVAANPHLAVIDSQALLSQGGYAAQPLLNLQGPTFTLSGVAQEDRVMQPIPVWVTLQAGGRAFKVTIIGVIDSRAYQTYGLFINQEALAAAAAPPAAPTNYYFAPRPGLDPELEKRRVEAAFLDHGLEATVTGDEILRDQGPRMLISSMLEGFVGLTLLMGVVALGLIAARAVVERRQQIGMLRALGYRRRTVGASLLLEAAFVGGLGSVAGVALGLALCRNLFDSNFFEQYKSGMVFVVPWNQLAAIVAIVLIASLLTTLVPAWQATRVMPAEALRYD